MSEPETAAGQAAAPIVDRRPALASDLEPIRQQLAEIASVIAALQADLAAILDLARHEMTAPVVSPCYRPSGEHWGEVSES